MVRSAVSCCHDDDRHFCKTDPSSSFSSNRSPMEQNRNASLHVASSLCRSAYTSTYTNLDVISVVLPYDPSTQRQNHVGEYHIACAVDAGIGWEERLVRIFNIYLWSTII